MSYPIFFGLGFGFGRGGSELFFGLDGGGNFGCVSPAVIASEDIFTIYHLSNMQKRRIELIIKVFVNEKFKTIYTVN